MTLPFHTTSCCQVQDMEVSRTQMGFPEVPQATVCQYPGGYSRDIAEAGAVYCLLVLLLWLIVRLTI